MTTMFYIDGATRGETRTQATARRLRTELARLGIKGTEAAKLCGVSQSWLNRRTNGVTPMAIDEVDLICSRLQISYEYVVTGIRAIIPPTPGSGLPLPRMDSNHQPPGSRDETSLQAQMDREFKDAA